jgi:hypothetical protein
MAKSTTQVAALHSNPRIAKALAAHSKDPEKYGSAAALCRAFGINDLPTQRSLRQILRDAGQGVGRGRRYAGITGPKVVKAQQVASTRAKGTSPVKAEPVAS